MTVSYFVKRESCPGCQSSNCKTIYSCGFLESPIKEFLLSFYSSQGGIEFAYLAETQFILEECQDCEMVFQQEIPNDFLMKKLYEEWIDPGKDLALHSQRDDLKRYSQYAEEVLLVINYFHRAPGQLKFLDVGMGWGKWCVMAKAFGCDVYGLDLSETRRQHAQSQGINVIAWEDIGKLSFDFINSEQVFEHLPQPRETLRYLKNSLTPQGLIKISTPDGSNMKKRLRAMDWQAPKESKNSPNPISPLEHINCFTHRSLIRMADICGLEPLKFSLGVWYASMINWKPIKQLLKNSLRPLYRNLFPRATYLFFRQAGK